MASATPSQQDEIKIKTPTSKYVFIVLFLLLVGFFVWTAYLWGQTVLTQRLLERKQEAISSLQQKIAAFSQIPGFDKFQSVVKLENSLKQIPWSRHIQMVSEIFEAVLGTDASETSNIILSDFQISLDAISVNGYVTNLRILYAPPPSQHSSQKKLSLIERFEQLSFLRDISIKNYTKDESGVGYTFTLTAKVINHDDEQ